MKLNVANKKNAVLQHIARDLMVLYLRKQDKIIGIKEYADTYGVGLGTVQAAFNEMKGTGAIQLNPCGAQGTFLASIDKDKLWQYCDYRVLISLLALDTNPYIKGLATGIYEAFTLFDLPISILFARGSKNRASILLRDKCDFVLMSELAYEAAKNSNSAISLVAHVGACPNEYGFITRNSMTPDWNRINIAYDSFSFDQQAIMSAYRSPECLCHDFPCVQLVDMVRSGEIEAALMERNSLHEMDGLAFHPLTGIQGALLSKIGRAVAVVREENESLRQLLQLVLSEDLVFNVQKKVMQGKQYVKY